MNFVHNTLRAIRNLSIPVLLGRILLACSSSETAAVDTGGVDAVADASPETSETSADTSDSAVDGSDGSACHDFTGAYAITGTCSVPGFSVFPAACIAQTGCTAAVAVDPGTLAGTVVGNTLTFGTKIGDIPLECTAVPAAGGNLTIKCSAAGGAATCDAVGARFSVPGASNACCNAATQNCGASQRCSIVGQGDTPATTSLLTACVPVGTLALGAACTRKDGRVGIDDCGKGLFCANVGQATATTRICQRLCQHTGDCGVGNACVNLAAATRAGVCRPTCTVRGTDCREGTCRGGTTYGAADPVNGAPIVVGTCSAIGIAAEGAPCSVSGECVANTTCARATGSDPFTCRGVCDRTHPCPAGQTCNSGTGSVNPDGIGFCTAK